MQKVKLGQHKTQQVYEVKPFDENAAEKVGKFNVLFFLYNFYIIF